MARSQQRQQASNTNTCHTHVVTTPSSQPAKQPDPVYLYLKCTNGLYLTENNKSVKAPSEILSPVSIWYEQHVGNGYFVYKSHNGRLLSVCDHGDVKLTKLKNPVKQKCMFYREQIGDHCRFRSVSGFFLCVEKGGHVTSTKTPQKNALFALQLVPTHSVPPPPQQAHVSRDAPTDSPVNTAGAPTEATTPYQPPSPTTSSFTPPSGGNAPFAGDSTYQPYAAQGFNSPTSFTPPPSGGYAPPPQNGAFVPPPQGGYAPPSQGGYAPPPQGGYAPPPQHGGYAPPSQGDYAPSYSSYTPYGAPASGGYGSYDASRDMSSPSPSQPASSNTSGSTPSYLQGLNASSTSNPYA